MRKLRFVLPLFVVLLAIPAATAHAVSRMPVGFFDDPSFRWSEDTTQNLLEAQRAHASIVHILANWATIAKFRPANPLNGNDPATVCSVAVPVSSIRDASPKTRTMDVIYRTPVCFNTASKEMVIDW